MKTWLPTLGVSLAAFIFVTSEFLPVGLLSEMAGALGRTESEIGLVMTIYAWCVAVLSVPLTAATTRFDRRPLMLALLAVFVGAHVLTAFAGTFSALVIARFFVAVAHAVFWAISIPLGIRVAPDGRRERAMGMVATGAALGSVLGIPAGTLLGQSLGWRAGFLAAGAFAAAVGFVLYRVLPKVPSRGSGSARVIADLVRRPKLVGLYLCTVVAMTGQFATFTYISPFLQRIGRVGVDHVATVLFVYGGAGLLGSFVSPFFLKHRLHATSVISLACVGACHLALAPAVATWVTTLALVGIWGFSFMFVNLVLQTLVLRFAADAEDVAMAGFSGIYNVGIGGGALLGSQLAIDHLGQIGRVGGLLAGVAWIVMLFVSK